ncbi:hypothetical protein BJ138DRAFT_1132321 [Hygrophoropsis aurantiaca]|uniref:Uncharacterized protein n=1 Tax=Hygrophoropsis aurantiaca TaxID=72124 RepID=A0ACB8ARM7_9AGAM|nr:hypothetical protein BJ138DRAFT_1132321 [Hygrophoropsis aurantiaca]
MHSTYILVIGSTACLGRALALSILDLPSKPTVIVCGRRKERLDELIGAHGAQKIPLDVVMFMNGIQHEYDFTHPEKISLDGKHISKVSDRTNGFDVRCIDVATELETNYLSIVNMTHLFLPHLIKVGKIHPSFIYTLTSGLGILPAAWMPNCCDSEAALHSFSLVLNIQLQDRNVHVVESLPPLVEPELHNHQEQREIVSKNWMPLDQFTALTMEAVQIPIGTSVDLYKRLMAATKTK